MAKAKKKTKSNHTQRRSEPFADIRAIISAVSTSMQKGKTENAYKTQLTLDTEAFIREYESNCSEDGLMAIRCFFFTKLPLHMPPNQKMAATFMEILTENDKKFARNIFETLGISLFASAYKKQTGCNPMTTQQFLDADDDVFNMIPGKYFNNEYNRMEKIQSIMHACNIEQAFQIYFDWNRVFNGKQLNDWAKNIMRFLKEIFSKETIDFFENERKKFVTEFANYIFSNYSELRESAIQDLKEKGAPVGLLQDQPSGLPLGRSVAPLLPPPFPAVFSLADLPQPVQNREYLRYSEKKGNVVDGKILSTELDNMKFALAFAAHGQLGDTEFSANLADKISSTISMDISFYTLIFYLAQYQSPQCTPMFVHTMFAFTIYRSFPGDPHEELYRDESAEPFRINTSIPHRLPEEIAAVINEGRAFVPIKTVTLSQFAYSQLKVILPPVLELPRIWLKRLEDIGFDEREAYLLSGYMSALRQQDALINLLESEGKEAGEDEAEEETRAFEESLRHWQLTDEERGRIREEVSQELQDQIAKAESDREQAETQSRRMERAQRLSSHRAETAESKLSLLQEENQRLSEQLEKLQKENAAMQESLLSIAAAETEPDSQADVQLYPTQIGKDIKISVYGGPQNWVVEQQKRFPNISFFGAQTRPDDAQVANSDLIILNTHVMSHKFFYILQGVCKRTGKAMYFIEHPGINKSSKRILDIYEEYIGGENNTD